MTRGKLDALFNNAAFAQARRDRGSDPKLLREQFEVNVFGTHDLTRRLIPRCARTVSGRIVNCSSVLGLVVAPYRGAYCASKFALEALTASLRLELEGSGISVSLIEPGPIRSRFVEHCARAAARNDRYRQLTSSGRLSGAHRGDEGRRKSDFQARARSGDARSSFMRSKARGRGGTTT